MYRRKIGEPQGLAKNIRRGVCPAGRDRTFEGAPSSMGEDVEITKKNRITQVLNTIS